MLLQRLYELSVVIVTTPNVSGYVGHVTIFSLNVYYCVMFSSRVGITGL